MTTTEARSGASGRVCTLAELSEDGFKVVAAAGHTVLLLLEQGQQLTGLLRAWLPGQAASESKSDPFQVAFASLAECL